MDGNNENEEKCSIIETPQKTTVNQQVSLSTSLQQVTNVCCINLYNLLDLATMCTILYSKTSQMRPHFSILLSLIIIIIIFIFIEFENVLSTIKIKLYVLITN